MLLHLSLVDGLADRESDSGGAAKGAGLDARLDRGERLQVGLGDHPPVDDEDGCLEAEASAELLHLRAEPLAPTRRLVTTWTRPPLHAIKPLGWGVPSG